MRLGTRIGAFTIVLGIWLAPWGADLAKAEPPKPCRDLASSFASSPEDLDIKSLARLGNCVTTELEVRLGDTEPAAAPRGSAPPATASQGNPPPPPPPAPQEGPPPPPARPRFVWPPPAPWVENWPPESPWDK